MQLDLQVRILQADAELAKERTDFTLGRERGCRLAGDGPALARNAARIGSSHIAAGWGSWDLSPFWDGTTVWRALHVDADVVVVLVEIYKRIGG
jgi:hypothetical protein